MKKAPLIAFLFAVTLFGGLTGCGKKKVVPVAERIAKVWTAQKVDYDKNTVYTRGAATGNIANYAPFRLDLGTPPTARFTEFDGNTFVGQYSVPADDRLVLTNLNPSPSGDNGTIEFSISNLSDNGVTLTRKTASQKAGGKIVTYTLTNP